MELKMRLIKSIQELDVKMTQFAANNGEWTVDENGKLVIKELEVEKIKIAGAQAQTVGRGVIVAGDMGITINTPAVSDKSSIAVTFFDDLQGRTWFVSERTSGTHFTIKLSANLATDVSFQWIVIDTDEDESDVQYSSAAPAPQPAPSPAPQPENE